MGEFRRIVKSFMRLRTSDATSSQHPTDKDIKT